VVVTALITADLVLRLQYDPWTTDPWQAWKRSGVAASCVETECNISDFTLPRSRVLTDEGYPKRNFYVFKRIVLPFSWQCVSQTYHNFITTTSLTVSLNFYVFPYIYVVRWARHVADTGDVINEHKILFGTADGKGHLRRPRRRWEVTLK
jgi:hypothetical protein